MRVSEQQHGPWDDDELERALRATFASARLSETIRCRTMDAVLASERKQTRSYRRRLVGQSVIPRVAALAALVLLFVVVSYVVDSRQSDNTVSRVQAAERLLALPKAGRGRHIVTSVYQRSSRVGGEQAWITEIWERTSVDGTSERAVEAREIDGEPIGRLVQTPTSWAMIYRGGIEAGDGALLWVPDELRLTSVSLDQVRSSLSDVDSSQVRTSGVNGHQIIEVNLGGDLDSSALAAIGSTLDQGVTSVLWRIELASDDERLTRASLVARSADGDEYVLTSSTVQTWEDVAGDQLAGAAFAMPTPLPASCSQRTIADSLPAELQLSEQYCEDGSIDHVVFSNGAGLTIDVTISPRSNRVIEPPSAHVRYIDTAVGEVAWVGHPDSGAPIGAVWLDTQSWYSITVLAEPRWTLEDLVILVEAITAAP